MDNKFDQDLKIMHKKLQEMEKKVDDLTLECLEKEESIDLSNLEEELKKLEETLNELMKNKK